MAWVNHFLEDQSLGDLKRLEPKLTRIEMPRGACLVSHGDPVDTVYLPINSIISVLATMRDGTSIESRTIGREGGYGLLHALGSPYSYERVEVQVGGGAWKIATADLAAAAVQSPTLVSSIVRHAQKTLVQTAQTAACNALHDAKHRLCRWLLLTRDRLGDDVVPLTQEHLSIMLGVQRTTVTALAMELQAQGWISYTRGRIRLLEPEKIKQCSCECYAAVEADVAQIESISETSRTLARSSGPGR